MAQESVLLFNGYKSLTVMLKPEMRSFKCYNGQTPFLVEPYKC